MVANPAYSYDDLPVLQPVADALELHDVSFRYGARTAWVLRHVNFSAAEGETVALTGPNGAGKTTAIKLAIGFLLPTEGVVRRGGLAAYDSPARRTAVYLADDPLVPRRLTAEEFFAFTAAARGLEETAFIAAAMQRAQELGLHRADLQQLGTSLSRGQLRKVALAAAFAEPPQFLAMDEPTEALDRAGRDLLGAWLKQFNSRGGAALIATHDTDFIAAVGGTTFRLE